MHMYSCLAQDESLVLSNEIVVYSVKAQQLR